MSAHVFWQRECPRAGETFDTPSGAWTVVESRFAHGGGFYVTAERAS